MLNRRNIIGGAAVLPIIAAASCGLAPAAASVSPRFAAVLAEAAAASAAIAAHETRVYQPAKAKAEALIAALPHTTVSAGPSVTGEQILWSTEKLTSVEVARAIVARARKWDAIDTPGLAPARELMAAHLRRERAAARIRRNTGQTAACERSNVLGDALVSAQYAVVQHPVSTAIDLAAKFAFMVEHAMSDGMDWTEELHADARRVAGLEG